MAFKQSEALGGLAERHVRGLMERAGIPTKPNPGESVADRTGWDFEGEVDGRRFLVEVKFDVMAAKTGNLAIEHYNTRSCRPSGISATKSDIWAVVLKEKDGLHAHLARTDELKHFCRNHKPFREIINGGDDNAALWLYRKEDILEEVFIEVESIDPAALQAWTFHKNMLE